MAYIFIEREKVHYVSIQSFISRTEDFEAQNEFR